MSNLGPNLSLLDRVLTDTVLVLDRAWTDLVHGQSFDRVLTDIGQRLDFLSNVSPKIVRPHEGNQYRISSLWKRDKGEQTKEMKDLFRRELQ